MSTKDTSPNQSPSVDLVNDSCLRIKNAINTIPYNDLVALLTESIDGGCVSDHALHKTIFIALDTLTKKASLGSETAIKHLLSIGNQITESIELLIGHSNDPIEKKIADESKFPESVHFGHTHALDSSQDASFENDLKLLTDQNPIELEKLYYLLRPNPEQAHEFDLESLTQYISDLEQDSKYRFAREHEKVYPLKSFEDLLYIHEFLKSNHPPAPPPIRRTYLEKDQYEFPEKYRFPEDAPAPPLSLEEIPTFTTQASKEIRVFGATTKSSKTFAYLIIRHLIAIRISHVSRRIVRRIAETSRAWPIKVTAFSDKRSVNLADYVESLNLGRALRIAFFNPSSAPRTRNSNKEAELLFVIEVLEKLSIERELRLPDCRCLGNQIPLAENPELQERIDAFINRPNAEQNRWIRMATFLPELSKEKQSLAKWHEAAMAWARAQCDGNWDTYSWPECISSRREQSNNHHAPRYNESLISQIFKEKIAMLSKEKT